MDYSLIVVGSFLQALSYVLFLAPYKIVPGGVYGRERINTQRTVVIVRDVQ